MMKTLMIIVLIVLVLLYAYITIVGTQPIARMINAATCSIWVLVLVRVVKTSNMKNRLKKMAKRLSWIDIALAAPMLIGVIYTLSR